MIEHFVTFLFLSKLSRHLIAFISGPSVLSCTALNESDASVVDVVLIETSLLFLCKFLLINMRTESLA